MTFNYNNNNNNTLIYIAPACRMTSEALQCHKEWHQSKASVWFPTSSYNRNFCRITHPLRENLMWNSLMTLKYRRDHRQSYHLKFLVNGAWYGKSYYRLLIGNHTLAFDWCHFWWHWKAFEGHFNLDCHFHVHFSNLWRTFASRGL